MITTIQIVIKTYSSEPRMLHHTVSKSIPEDDPLLLLKLEQTLAITLVEHDDYLSKIESKAT